MSIFHTRWTRFELRKPRNPFLRAVCAVVGLFLLAGLVVLGLLVGTLMLAFTLLHRLLRSGPRTAQDGTVINGSYSVIRQRSRALPH
ncbi:MAG TPA: hypothetical protein DDZ76_05295 [Xanthomonadales bacterium]|nr:hypothetical protein [Xanthomonadales bacterium]HBS35427.1 hypothetical protein [Parvularcula sp.]